jgi:hypothetical protein
MLIMQLKSVCVKRIKIRFFTEDIDYSIKQILVKLLKLSKIKAEQFSLLSLNFINASIYEALLLNLNERNSKIAEIKH